ncbi:nitroreductase family protein [Paraclostridium benzoelyticum]|uniref:nitroreductase family protein n=1 Tax=Paraclostridium benzoelyticum TaxID=1629550 RepID=UPI0031CDAD33
MKRLDFIYDRVSIRSYKEDKVPREDIIEIIKAGTYAPSGKNLQNWHFVVVTDKDKVREIANIVEKRGLIYQKAFMIKKLEIHLEKCYHIILYLKMHLY